MPRVELGTYALGVRCSIRLSYIDMGTFYLWWSEIATQPTATQSGGQAIRNDGDYLRSKEMRL